MKKFLDKAATFILENCREGSLHTAVIFPNRRSGVFLKDHLKQKVDKDFWLPEFFTTDEFMVRASGLQKTDPVLIFFELFKIHREIAGADARSIDDFLVWAPVILSDFNDIDLYLTDAPAVFTNLSDAKAIQAWNPDGSPLTEMQQNYLGFFRSLGSYYSKLKAVLQGQRAGYTGWVYRYLAENTAKLSQGWPWERFIVIGLNALSKSEKQVFGYLKKHYKVDFLWDADEYYLSPEKFGLKQMEAGRFVRELIAGWQINSPKWIHNLLAETEKNIQVTGLPKRIGQVKYAGQLLENLLKNEQGPAPDTAVVLADEKMLVPMLNALPEVIGTDGKKPVFNITMGYSLAGGPLSCFVLQWLGLHIKRQEESSKRFSVLHLNALLNNPVVKFMPGTERPTDRLASLLGQQNNPYLSAGEINSILSQTGDETGNKLLSLFLHPLENAVDFIDAFVAFLKLARPVFLSDNNKQELLKEEFNATARLVKNLRAIITGSGETVNLKALQKIYNQLSRRSEVNLRGEPLSGIQVMGMLETRNLDFKNIILLSANEGILPKAGAPESFIPFDIRAQFKLPLPKDKIDVFAYHFYRLLQRAQNITLIYNSEADELGGGEKSRFILQLKDELARVSPKIKFSENMLNIALSASKREQPITIPKTPEIIDALKRQAAQGFSPSALNNYIQCPLRYYFSKILGLRPPESIDGAIESNTFGTIIHETLQHVYTPFLNKIIEPEALKNSLKKVDGLLLQSFKENLNNADFRSGKNLLTFEVAKKYVKDFILADTRKLKTKPQHLLGLEMKLKASLTLGDKEVFLNGTIDRIDKETGSDNVLLADYKTGKVVKKDLKVEGWETLLTDHRKSKAFQLLFYTYLYLKNNAATQEITPGIFSFRNSKEGFITLALPEGYDFNELTHEFEKVLTEILLEIFDSEVPFTQTGDADACIWCDYQNICNRTTGY
ncbi:MAG: PD-(D/E)XK nuclease family protein [Bacteroidales bacterium]|nr:PD-(D/E)XK nuclease family protein [Bacteroidales bacterium]